MRLMILLAVGGLALMVRAATAQTVAFQADFDLDTPGAPPNSNPPGDPPGDLITLWTQGGPITVVESVGQISGQPLLLDRQQTGSFGVRASLDPDTWYCGHYTIRWRSASMNNVYFFSCSAQSGNSQVLASVEYRQGYVLSFLGSTHTVPVPYQIGAMQEFVIALDMGTKKASLSVDGVAYPELQDLSQYQVGGDGLKYFSFSAGGVDALRFVVDDLEITADCSETAAGSTSWSRVKSLYR